MSLLEASPWIVALAIFLARVADVSLGTVRILVGFRGYRLLATVVGFLEAGIWVIAASKVLTNLDQWYLVVAYAGGFAAGNYVGITLERRLGVGRELARIISYSTDVNLCQALTGRGYSVVELKGAQRNHRPVEVLFVSEARRRMPALLKLVHDLDPTAIYTVTDVKSAHGEGGSIPQAEAGFALRFKRK